MLHFNWITPLVLLVAVLVIVGSGVINEAITAAPDWVLYPFIVGALMFVVPSSAVYGFWGKAFLVFRLVLVVGCALLAAAFALGLLERANA